MHVRADLGQPLVRDAVTWYEHSSASYARQNTPQTPTAGQGLRSVAAVEAILASLRSGKRQIIVTKP